MNRTAFLASLGAAFALALGVSLPVGSVAAASVFTRIGEARGSKSEGTALGEARGTLLRLDGAAIQAFRIARGGRLAVPVDGGVLQVTLRPFDIQAGGRLTVTDERGTHPADVDVSLFRGEVEGDPGSWAVIAMSPQGVMGTIETAGRRRVFGTAEESRDHELPLHVLADEASAKAVAGAPWICGVDGDAAERGLRHPGRPARSRAPSDEIALNTNRLEFKVAVDCDYEVYAEKFAGNLANAASYVLTVLGTVSLIYERDVHAILTYPYLNFWTVPGDPYGGASTSVQLPEFRNYWNANMAEVDRSLAHLVSGRSLGGGIAYLDALCSSFGYGVSAIDADSSYPTNVTTWDVELIAHEIGHNFGSPHTHSCFWQSAGYVPPGALLDSCYAAEGPCNSGPRSLPPDRGTIMSYCHLFSGNVTDIRLDFHAACKTEMRLSAEAAGCLTPVALQPPKLLTATPTPTGTTIAWTAGTTTGVLSYDVHRSGYQLDLGTPKRGSTSTLSLTDTTFGDWYYRVRSVRAADTSQFSGELKVTVCAFDSPARFPTGSNPLAAARGDFNHDGIEDLATANVGSNNVSILLGLGVGGVGNGAFGAHVSYPAGAGPTCVTAGDWNADGIIDLAVGNIADGSVSLFLGQGAGEIGNGTFAPGTTVPDVSGPWDIAQGDFNEDGIRDLVTAGGATSTTVLLGNGVAGVGDGTFTVGPVLADGSSPRAVVVADLNQDGIWDLAVAHTLGARVYLGGGNAGRGDGTFGPGADYACGTSPFSITAAQVDGDDILDLVVANVGSNTLSILLGQGTGGVGDGTFAPAAHVAAGTSPYGLRVADWSGDGFADLLVANAGTTPTLSILVGDRTGASGTFGPPSAFIATDQPRNTQLGDFNEDGKADVVAISYNGSAISVLEATCASPLPTMLAVTSPNGGEIWAHQSEQTIGWAKGAAVLAVNIEVSRDGGVSWQRIADQVTGTSFTWSVTEPLSSSAKVRVVDTVIPSRVDASDALFTVAPQSAVGVADAERTELALARPWPNPARRQVTVSLALPDDAPATLELIDLAGRLLVSRSVGHLGAGWHQVTLDPKRMLAQGIYLIRLARAGETRSVKVALID